jgi:hypothetical protein
MKNKLWLVGMVCILAVMGLAFAGCSLLSEDSIKGTKWEGTQDVEFGEEITIALTSVVEFTSETEGTSTITYEVTKGELPAEADFEEFFPSGPQKFTYTYSAGAGTLTVSGGSAQTFTVDVPNKKLTIPEGAGEGKDFVYKLK